MDPCGVVVVEDPGCPADGSQAARPPALAHVANRPLLDHVVDVLLSAGAGEIVVASSTRLTQDVRACLAPRESRDAVRLSYVDKPAPLGLAGGMRLAAALVGQAPCIVHAASGLMGEPLAPYLHHLDTESADAVMIVHQSATPYGHLSCATRQMLHLAELDPERAALGIAGVALFGPGALRRAALADWWPSRDVDLTVLADLITAAGGTFHVRRAGFAHGSTGSALDLLELNRIVLDGLTSDDRRQESHGNRIEGRVHIDEEASVRASVIVGPVVIGAGARIADAYIGPYTSIGAGARIEGAEIERSIVSAGAVITHIGCRLAGSVIGRDARVFRDFSLPRALRLCVGDGTEVALS